MKTNSLTAPVSVSRKRVQVSNPLTWANVRKFYDAMPGEVTPCKSVYAAKMYTAALLAVLSIAFLPLVVMAWFVYSSAKKGGQS